ncbi:MAG TPA: hypothetical protein VME01_02160 [Solirubrobacteraceae bacterium]|nr:hypothetical protein [Solirubrobacteraceae bacterium]
MDKTQTTIGDTPDLEIALLRRSLGDIGAQSERCDGCHRAMLIGERVYEYASGSIRCELCREARVDPVQSHTVHGPAFGHSIRIIDNRQVA